MLALQLLAIAALSYLMGRAAQWIATSLRVVALSLGFSQFLVAFVLLGLATSTPEISVAVFSAIEGRPGLSLGNLIGANIVILSLMCGLAAIVAGKLRPREFSRNRLLPLFLLDVLLPVWAIADGRLTRVDGVALILAHVLFLGHVYRRHMPTVIHSNQRSIALKHRFWKHVLRVAASTAVLLVASYFLVHIALAAAATLGVAPMIIGLLLFSIGTNVPELTFVLTQSRRNGDIVMGDLFGSVLTNTPTLGLLALISPFALDSEQLVSAFASSAFLVALWALFGWCMWTDKSLERREGYWLVLFYAAFLAFHMVRTAGGAG